MIFMNSASETSKTGVPNRQVRKSLPYFLCHPTCLKIVNEIRGFRGVSGVDEMR